MNNNLNSNFDTLNSTNNINNTSGVNTGNINTNTSNVNVVNNPGTINNNVNAVPNVNQTTNVPVTGAVNPSVDSNVNNGAVPISPVNNQNNTEVLGAVDNNSNTSSNNTDDDNYVYTPPSKFRYFLLIMFFFLLLGMIIFLPELTQIINLKLSGGSNQPEVIVDGTLECSLKKTGTSLDVVFNAKFNFTDQKLDKLVFTTTTNGDSKQDNEVFNENYNKCQLLKDSMTNISGVAIRCDLNSSSVATVETINYNVVDLTKATSAFAEAGGTFPEFESREDISKIEREMNASGYTCNKYK